MFEDDDGGRVLTAITDDLEAFCRDHDGLIDGKQIDQIVLPHGLLTKTPSRGAKSRSLHLRRREEVVRHVRRELKARNLRLDLRSRPTGVRESLYVLRDAVEGSIEQLRNESTVPQRRAKRVVRAFTDAVERSPRFVLPAHIKKRVQKDALANVADIARVLQRSYDQLVDITVELSRVAPDGVLADPTV